MTDEATPTAQPLKKDDKKPLLSSQGNGRGAKKNNPNPRPASGAGGSTQASGGGGPRPLSRSGKKAPTSAPATGADSGSESAARKGGAEVRKTWNKNPGGGGGPGRSGSHRKAQPSASQGGRQGNKDSAEHTPNKSSPAAPADKSSDALSSLQRVIADLKTASPASQSPASVAISMPPTTSNLAPNAPVFQPGAATLSNMNAMDPKHRKAVSLGVSGHAGNPNTFSPHLPAMMEDAEDRHANASIEDGEIQENYHQHQPRSQSQSFMAPRFAALAAQQDQADFVGPSGRPQLAPGFLFGARRRGQQSPMAPPINEEDVGFQFPQQQQQNFQPEMLDSTHRKPDNSEISGIMAEQVRNLVVVVFSHFTHHLFLDCDSESD
jgi:protein SSD1